MIFDPELYCIPWNPINVDEDGKAVTCADEFILGAKDDCCCILGWFISLSVSDNKNGFDDKLGIDIVIESFDTTTCGTIGVTLNDDNWEQGNKLNKAPVEPVPSGLGFERIGKDFVQLIVTFVVIVFVTVGTPDTVIAAERAANVAILAVSPVGDVNNDGKFDELLQIDGELVSVRGIGCIPRVGVKWLCCTGGGFP